MNKLVKHTIAGLTSVLCIFSTISFRVNPSVSAYTINEEYYGTSEQELINSLDTSASDISKVTSIANYVCAKYGGSTEYNCTDVSNFVINMLRAIGIESYVRFAGGDFTSAGAFHQNVVAYIEDVPYIIEADGGGKARIGKASEWPYFMRNKGFSDGNFVYYTNDDGKTMVVESFVRNSSVVSIPESVVNWRTGEKVTVTLIDKIYFVEPNNIKKLIIPDTVTAFTDNVGHLSSLKSVEEIVLSKNITTLPLYCLDGLSELKTINLENITSYGYMSLCNTGLTSIEFNPNAIFLADPYETSTTGILVGYTGTLLKCKNLVSAVLPSKLTYIPNGLFNACVNLKSVVIPSSVTKIENMAFNSCASLEALNIPNSVVSIGESAFGGCPNLVITVPDSVTNFGSKCLTGVKKVICSPNSACAKYCEANNINVEYSTKLDIGNATVTLGTTSYLYNGAAKKPSVTVSYAGKALTSSDYSVSYINNKDAGTATVLVTGIGNYSGTKAVNFTIEKDSMENCTANGFAGELSYSTHAYTGSELKPTIALRNTGGVYLTKDTDYVMNYKNNLNAGTATVTVTGIGNYTGSLTRTFTITPLAIPTANYFNSTISQSEFVYTGSPIKPTMTIDVGDQTATAKDMDYTYTNNVNVGTGTVKATCKGNFTGTFSKTFTISAKPITSSDISIAVNSSTYIPTIKSGSSTLVNNTDYTYVIDKSNINTNGTVTTLIYGKGNYSGNTRVVTSVSVTPHTHSFGNWTVTKAATCDAAGIQTRSCSCGETETASIAALGHNYTSKVVAPTASADGYTLHTCSVCGSSYKDNYTKYVAPAVTTVNISSCASSLAKTSYVYTGSAIKPAATVTYNGKALVNGTDYTVTYKNNINKGTATATITGKGNYTGSKDITFSITAKSLSAATLKLSATSYAYNGSARKPGTTVTLSSKTLVKNTDYTVTYKNNINKGTATVTITGKGNYSGTKSTTFTIKALALSKVTVTGLPKAKYYTAKAIKPALTLKYGTKTLKAGTDYTIAYKNNKAIGKATITLKGKGNFSGTVTLNFKIIPKKTTLKTATSPKTKRLKVTYSKVANITGYQIVYSTSSDFSKNKKSVNTKATSKTISSLTKGKTYYVKVRTYKTVGGTKYYSGYSAVKKVKIK